MIFYTVDFAADIPAPLQSAIETKVKQIFREPPKGIVLVRIEKVAPRRLQGVNADFACIATVCGARGVPLPDESQFMLYRLALQPEVLSYVHI